MKIKTDWRTLSNRLRAVSHSDFVTYSEIGQVTGLSPRQCASRLKNLEGLNTRPKKFLIEHAAKAIVGG